MIQDMWNALLHQPNTQWVVLSTMLLGIASGVLGSFALLKKQSLIGDAVAHAALPGICIAYLLIGEKQLLVLLLGATATGLLATYLIQLITTTTRIKKDAAICLILSVFFGTGIVLLSRITQQAGGNKSGLDHFIFGQAAAMTRNDVYTMAGAAGGLILIAGSIGACSGIVGALISTISTGLATGPLIVVTAAGCFIVSFTIGPKRGLIQKLMAHRVRLKEESI
ncbi:metal ABC transporter permease [Terribacillus saccharophilus]|uniref:metal ABC transporter permease n=1 Tax=Terribacillus saccharophilus TaxID=361277 RepID=UPI00069056BA|nr:metal ABC transporter permease [Terribacillus goriensis]